MTEEEIQIGIHNLRVRDATRSCKYCRMANIGNTATTVISICDDHFDMLKTIPRLTQPTNGE